MTNSNKYNVALLLYRLVFFFFTPIILLLLIFRSKKNSAYRKRLLERLGFTAAALKKNSIVIHAASVGEVIAIKSFVEQLLSQYPHKLVTITTFTPTGSAQVKKLFAERVQHCYLPLDNFFSTLLFLRRIKPQALVFMETELWPNLLAQCAKKKLPLLLINARLSAKSCRNYQKIHWLMTPRLQNFDHVLCQSEEHQQNFIKLGAIPQNCTVSGNIKYDISITSTIENKAKELANYLPVTREVWLVASTHLGDDEIAINTFIKLKQQHPTLLLILVPRHPERFAQVASLCRQNNLNIVCRSEDRLIEQDSEIWLLDSLGELTAAYSLASVVTVAGSFSTIGGHNPLEATLFKKPIVVGADMHNFTDVLMQLLHNNAIVQLSENTNIEQQLSQEVSRLLSEKDYAQQLGNNAHQVMLGNQGASSHSVEKLLALVK